MKINTFFITALTVMFISTSVWATRVPEPATEHLDIPLLIRIHLDTQKMTVQTYGEMRYYWKVATGRRRHETPSGWFRIDRLKKRPKSQSFFGFTALMPFSLYFSGGSAICGTLSEWKLGLSGAYHGNVLLSYEHARILFQLVKQYGIQRTYILIR